ncbi:proton/oligopeptide symporter [Salmonella enterica subsp. enterica]|uniref:Proton/oligopeptide symporter n=1 Tax=Salmonella enterica I TaxID=59201 RepID=A0A447U3W3_SALET|nr:proton/oligopeptide symporter [Salmonella enterica subsp. enterica]
MAGSTAFALSVVGMLITVVNFAFCQRWVKSYGSKPDFEPINFRNLLLTIVGYCRSDCGRHLAAAQPGYRAYGAGRNRSWHRHYLR